MTVGIKGFQKGNTINVGRIFSDEHKKKISETAKKRWGYKNGFYGKHHSELTKNKIRKSHIGLKSKLRNIPRTAAVKKKISNTLMGRTLSEEIKNKIRISSIQRFKNGKIKKSNTSIEKKIEQELKKRNIVYQPQVPLCNISVVDFYLPEYNIVIFCDGCYWHNCKDHYPNKSQTAKDMIQNKILTEKGYFVYRFWEHDINASAKKCIDSIII